MRIKQRTIADVAVLSVSGDLTLSSVGAKGIVARMLQSIDEGERWFLLDLARVGYVDSAGLGQLIQAHLLVSRHGGAIKILHANQRLKDLLVVTRVTEFACFENRSDALLSLNAPAVSDRHRRAKALRNASWRF